ncbi:hypothetical protein cand_033800 [Cryptosporidium andersoni]|uniref:Uncharacterized protein n=1 Tax=Cryptosporidium andersoni TaxID=117008 RepID=A0A1J4MVM0_9CRYT|nr:hypothetical protein cand_033800 [Cryptosporidium andersoni]
MIYLHILILVLLLIYSVMGQISAPFTGWTHEGLKIDITPDSINDECRLLQPIGSNEDSAIKISFRCKEDYYLSYIGINGESIKHGEIKYIDSIQSLKIGCSDGSSYISFGGSDISHYNNTIALFPTFISSINAGFISGNSNRPPVLVLLEGYFGGLMSFSAKRKSPSMEILNSGQWSGNKLIGGCFMLTVTPQPRFILYSISAIGFITEGTKSPSLNLVSNGINARNILIRQNSVFQECQILDGPGIIDKNNTITYYSLMCPKGQFSKFRIFKRYCFGTYHLSAIEFECKSLDSIKKTVGRSHVTLGKYSGTYIAPAKEGELTSFYAVYFNSTNNSRFCKESTLYNPVTLRYYNDVGKEFASFINTQFEVQRLLKRKATIRERLWVGKDPFLLCAGINKEGSITSIGIGYKSMIEPIPLYLDAVNMVKPDIIAYPLSMSKNQTLNTAISYNPDVIQITFGTVSSSNYNLAYSPNLQKSGLYKIRVSAQCKPDLLNKPQYISRLILFVDGNTGLIQRIAGVCKPINNSKFRLLKEIDRNNTISSNSMKLNLDMTGNITKENEFLNSTKDLFKEEIYILSNSKLFNETSNNVIHDSEGSKLENRLLKEYNSDKLMELFDTDRWPLNKWVPSPFRVQHPSWLQHEKDISDIHQSNLDISFAFGQSLSSSTRVVISKEGPFNSIYAGFNPLTSNLVMLSTGIIRRDSRDILLKHYSNLYAPTYIALWEVPSIDGVPVVTDSICVELEQYSGKIIGLGFEGSMNKSPPESEEDIKITSDGNIEVTSKTSNLDKFISTPMNKTSIYSNMNSSKNSSYNGLVIEPTINNQKCPKMAYNMPLIEYLENQAELKNNENRNSKNKSQIATSKTITCPMCSQIEYIKIHYIQSGPIIGIEWKCKGINHIETISVGGKSPSQLATQVFTKVQPQMIELAFASNDTTLLTKDDIAEPLPGPAFISINGLIGSGHIHQLLYYRAMDTPLLPTVTFEMNHRLRAEKNVLTTICVSLSSSQAILGLGFGFEFMSSECLKELPKPIIVPVISKNNMNPPNIIVKGPRIYQRVDIMHPFCTDIQGGAARTRLSNWWISFSCLDSIDEEVPFTKLSTLSSNSFHRQILTMTLYCPDKISSVSVGQNIEEGNTKQTFDLQKPGSLLAIDFTQSDISPIQIKLIPSYSNTVMKSLVSNVGGFNQILVPNNSIYGICFEITSDGNIAGIAFANRPSNEESDRIERLTT